MTGFVLTSLFCRLLRISHFCCFLKYDEHICLNMNSEKNVMQIRCFLKHKARILALHRNQSAIALCVFLILLRAPTSDRWALMIYITDVDLKT